MVFHVLTLGMNQSRPVYFLALFLIPLVTGEERVPEPPRPSIPVVMQLDWIFNAQFAGLLQAKAQGFYEEAGLEVEIRPTNHEQLTVDRVLAGSGTLTLGSAESNVLLGAHAGGAPIKALATMFQGSPMGWMFLESSSIETFADLAGKRIGIHPDGEKVLRLAARNEAVSVEDFFLPEVGYKLDPLLSGEIDVMQAYVIDEFVQLKLKTDGAADILMAHDYGYSAYSQVFFTSEEALERWPQEIAAFLAASKRGWEYAFDHPEETVDLILQEYNPTLDRAYQLASLEAIEDLVSPDGLPVMSPMDPEVWARSQELFVEFGLLDAPTDLEKLLDFRFNP
jgi:ABC-type nitrate/sulfonate/bicarbonate transport system substrate-binding protein